MKVFISIDKSGKVLSWGSSPDSENYVEVYLPLDHDILVNPGTYSYIDGDFVKDNAGILTMAKEKKEKELSIACQEAILDGFYHIIEGIEYKFSFDTESQLNFQGAERMLSQGLVENISWTVRENGVYKRIPINKEIMGRLTFVILRHKDSNIARFREFLMPLVNEATTMEELEKVKW